MPASPVPDREPAAESDGLKCDFSTFALIWGITTLVHQLAFTFWLETWPGWLLTFSAACVILEPRCLVRFGALVASSLINLYYKLPFVPNHILFEGMLNLTLLVGLGWAVWAGRRGLPARATLVREIVRRFGPFAVAAVIKAVFLAFTDSPPNPVFGGLTSLLLLIGLGYALNRPPVRFASGLTLAAFAPVMRVEIIIMYFWAVIQKLNWDYLNTEVSCASQLHLEIAEILPFVPTGVWSLNLAIYGSLAFEAGIPLLLMVPRLRALGFLAAFFFHIWLSIHPAPGIYSFSSLIFAALFLFLTKGRPELLRQQTVGWFSRMSERLPGRIDALGAAGRLAIVVFLAVLFTQAAIYLQTGRNMEAFGVANRLGFAYWLLWGLLLGGSYLVVLWRTRSEASIWGIRARWNPAWLVVLLVIGNGLNPWLGLKTQTSFSMYSNLRSESFGNHLFLRRIDVFPFQRDLVEVLVSLPDITSPTERPTRIQQFANTGRIFPFFELRRLMSEWPEDVEVVYRRHAQEWTASKTFAPDGSVSFEGDPDLFRPIPLYLYKTLWFRRHESFTGCMSCTH